MLHIRASVHPFKPPFAIYCQVLSQSIRSFPLTYCPFILFCIHSFSVSFTSSTLYYFGSTAYEKLTTLISPTFLSNASSLFVTHQLKLFSSLLTQLSQLIKPLPPFFLGTYILETSLLACSSLFIVLIFLDFLSIS